MQHLRHRRGDIDEDFFRTRRDQPNRSPLNERAIYDAPDRTGHKGIARADRNANLRLGFRALRDHSAVMVAQLC
jgi:hypothetical protein